VNGRGSDIPDDLIARAGRGDETALTRLAELAYPRVRRWARVQVGEEADADDLTQEVLIKMIRSLDSFHGDAAFETWLYAMTRNAAKDAFRARGREARREEDPRSVVALRPDPAPDPDRRVERAEARDRVLQAFRRLPTRQREAFDLVELQGLSSGEAGEILGIEAVSVRAHLFKARRAMRTLILGADAGATGGAA
jgi:RNA polymerase sigma-70 factor (ECF subfamily)